MVGESEKYVLSLHTHTCDLFLSAYLLFCILTFGIVITGRIPLGYTSAYLETSNVKKYEMPPFDKSFDFEKHCVVPIQEILDKVKPK